MITVLVVDDHELVRTGICRMLEDHADVQVIGQAESGEEAINLVRQYHPNVVLLDVNMPGIGGVETTRRLLQTAPETKVLAVSGLAEEPYPSLLLKAGAKGYITKGAPVTEMVRAINKVMQGGKYFSADIAEQLASSYLSDTQTSPFDALSEREMQVAMMVVNCISAQEISDKLFVSVKTVNTYRYRIFEKLNIDSDVKLTHLAIRYGLIKPWCKLTNTRMLQYSTNIQLNQYRLGVWYASYRLFIGCCLLLVYLLTYEQLFSNYQYPILYRSVLIGFIFISAFQLLSLKHVRKRIPLQLTLLFIIDVISLSLLTFATDGPNLQLSLLFVITIFASCVLVDKQKALIITLIAVITLVYQHFIGTLFSISSLNTIGNSAVLAFLFFVVYGSWQIAVRRFQVLENLNFYQSQELDQLQNINRYILEQTELGYLVLDENWHMVLSNPAACALLGISPIYAHDKYPLYKAQPDLFELLKFDQLKNGEKFQFTSQLSRFQIQIEIQKLQVPNQTLTLFVLQDAQKINQRVQQLKLAALGQLSASIAHEIRNPLAAITQANELMQLNDPQQELLHNMIAKQASRIDKIIGDTLNMARSKETYPTLIDVASFLERFIVEDLPDVKDQIDYRISDQAQIQFDEQQLRQVLINLIRNAIRHNAAEAEHIHIRVYSYKNLVHIDVCDFGEGVATQDQSTLFQPFFSTSINGTGLGLYLSHSFCEANQAKLYYVEQKIGACFRIECPRINNDV